MTDETQDWSWPDFNEPELTGRLLLDDDDFLELWSALAAQQ